MDKEQTLREILGLVRTAMALNVSLMPPAGVESKEEWNTWFETNHPLFEAIHVYTKAIDRLEEAKEVA